MFQDHLKNCSYFCFRIKKLLSLEQRGGWGANPRTVRNLCITFAPPPNLTTNNLLTGSITDNINNQLANILYIIMYYILYSYGKVS